MGERYYSLLYGLLGLHNFVFLFFSSLSCLPNYHPSSISNPCSLFSLIIVTSMYMCLFISKYNLRSLYNVTHISVFRFNHWSANPWGRLIFPTFGIPDLPVVLYVGLRPCGFFPCILSCLLMSLLSSCLGGHVGETFIGTLSDII